MFGPNGSGKSTVLKALAFVAWFMRDSFHHPGPNLPIERFNDAESANRPIKLAVEIGGVMELSLAALDWTLETPGASFGVYRYELELQPNQDGSIRTVTSEILRQKRHGQTKWTRVFERDRNGTIIGSKTFPLTRFTQVIDKVRENASVIATLALFEHEPSKILDHTARIVVSNILLQRVDPLDQDVIQYLSRNPHVLQALNRELQRVDVGIEEMYLQNRGNGDEAFFRHHGLDVHMPLTLQSHGTRTFIRLFPTLMVTINAGGLAVIDELDQAIHPTLLPEILRWFYEGNAQLWMSCHSVSLLDDLTKEEVVFCEKDQMGRTSVFSLMDVQKVRRSDNLYKKYMGGVYGAVPQIG
jgi:predicted ATPase